MIKHQGFEHELPNGDILIVEATDIRPEVDEAFRQANEELEKQIEEVSEQLESIDGG